MTTHWEVVAHMASFETRDFICIGSRFSWQYPETKYTEKDSDDEVLAIRSGPAAMLATCDSCYTQHHTILALMQRNYE